MPKPAAPQAITAEQTRLLLSITEDLAVGDDLPGMFVTMMEKVKPAVGFHDAVIMLVDADQGGLSVVASLMPPDVRAVGMAQEVEDGIQHENSPLFADWTAVKTPLWWDVAAVEVSLPTGRPRHLLTLMREAGLTHSLNVPLTYQNKPLGLLMLHFKQPDFYGSTSQFAFLQAIGTQLSLGLYHYLEAQRVADAQRQTNLLLAMGQAISAVRGIRELCDFLAGTVQPIFGFTDALVVVPTAMQQQLSVYPCLPVRAADADQVEDVQEWASFNVSPAEFFTEWFAAPKPAWADVSQYRQRYTDYADWTRLGNQTHAINVPLRFGERAVGLLLLNVTDEALHGDERNFPMLESVASQLAVTLSNVLANEEIAHQEAEKTLLYEVSQAVASMEDLPTLFATLVTKLQPVLRFDAVGIVVPSSDQRTMRIFTPPAEGEPTAVTDWRRDTNYAPVSFEPSYAGWLSAATPQPWNSADYAARYPDYPSYQLIADMGLVSNLAVPLRFADQTLGLLFLNSRQPHYGDEATFPLLMNVAQLIALALNNLLTDEALRARQEEQALALAVSNAFSSPFVNQQKYSRIAAAIHALIPLDFFALFTPFEPRADGLLNVRIRREGRAFVPFPYVDTVEAARGEEDLTWAEQMRQSVKLFYEPALYTGDDFVKLGRKHNLLRLASQTLNLRSTMFVPFRLADGTALTLSLSSTQPDAFVASDLARLQAIVPQLSVGLANIVALATLAERQAEQTLSLAVSTALSAPTTDQQKFATIARAVNQLIPTDYFSIFPPADPAPMARFVVRLHRQGDDFVPPPFLEKIAEKENLSVEAWEQRTRDNLPVYTQEAVYVGEDLRQACAQYPALQTMASTLGVQSLLLLPFRLADATVLTIALGSRTAQAFTQQDLHRVRALVPQLSVGLENIAAADDIARRETEKSLLLTVNNALISLADKQAKFEAVANAIDAIIPTDQFGIFPPENTVGYEKFAVRFRKTDEGFVELPYLAQIAEQAKVDNDGWNQQLRDSGDLFYRPGVYNGQVFEALCAQYEVIRTGHEVAGTNANLFVPLTLHDGTPLTVFLGSSDPRAFNEDDLVLMQSLAPQLVLALENILSTEQVARREAEKSLLLTINNALLTLPDSVQQFTAVAQAIDQRIAHDMFGIFPIDNLADYAKMTVQFTKVDGRFANPQVMDDVREVTGLDAAAFAKDLAEANELFHTPGVYAGAAFQQLCERYGLVRLGRDAAGVRAMITVPLLLRNQRYFALHLSSRSPNAFTEEDLHTTLAIVPQLVLAMENIMTSQDVARREAEKSLLLSISEQIAVTTRVADLYAVVSDRIRPLLRHFDGCLMLPTPDRSHIYVYASQSSDELRRRPGYRQAASARYPLDESYAAWMLADGPQYWITADQHRKHPQHQGYQFMLDNGILSGLTLPLRANDRPLGLLFFTFTTLEHIDRSLNSLLYSVANLVSIAMNNLLSTHQLAVREEEKTLQLAVNNALIGIPEQTKKFEAVANAIHTQVPMDFFGLYFVRPRDEQVGFPIRLRERQGRFVSASAPLDQVREEAQESVEQVLAALPPDALVARTFVGEAFDNLSEHFKTVRTGQQLLGLRSLLQLPLTLNTGEVAAVFLGSTTPFAFSERDLLTLEELRPQLTMSLDNLLAFKKIELLQDKLAEENVYLIEEIKQTSNFDEMIGNSPQLQEIFQQISEAAPTNVTILIKGETGTGKELIARAIHNNSPRKGRPLIKVNCAALPENLIESELFGHEKGSFTGAIDRRIGKFELANGGTIFLDEIGELPLALQAKLLRVLQEKEIERVGGKGTIALDIRVIAATNRNLQEEVAQGNYRADLYFRLDVFPITSPALRDRKEDLPALAMYFVNKFARSMGKRFQGISNEALKELMAYDWPGNIRELEHVMEYSVITCRTPKLELGRALRSNAVALAAAAGRSVGATEDATVYTLEEAERRHILRALQRSNGKIKGDGGAAEILDIHPNTLQSRMKKLGIVRTHIAADR